MGEGEVEGEGEGEGEGKGENKSEYLSTETSRWLSPSRPSHLVQLAVLIAQSVNLSLSAYLSIYLHCV